MKDEDQKPVRIIYGKSESRKERFSLRSIPDLQNKVSTSLQYGAFFLLLFGIKLWTIYSYGNATPFGDQWDAEAANLYKPFFDNTLDGKSLIAPHNEHRILTTRIEALVLLVINKTWNPLLQMMVNAFLHVFVIMIIVSLLNRVTGRNNAGLLLAFCLALFSLPYAWENILVGFQGQFYFVVLFGVLSLWLIIRNKPLSSLWWVGFLCSVLAFFSLASGVFVSASAALVSLLFIVMGIRRNLRQFIAMLILIAFFVIGVYLTPSLPDHLLLKASSLHQFYKALVAVFGWPVGDNIATAVFCNIPIAFFCLNMLRKRPSAADKKWFLAGLALWAVSQAITIAYGRASVALASRYRDLFAILVLVNFACLISIALEYRGRLRNLVIGGVGMWSLVIIVFLGLYAGQHLPGELSVKLARNKAEELNIRNYLAKNDITQLKDKPEWEIPYPDADLLARTINLPGIREILPANISPAFKPDSVSQMTKNSFIINGYSLNTPKIKDSTWGSYTVEMGDSAIGEMTLHFNAKYEGKIAIPVSGYPLKEKIKLEVEQNGVRKIARINYNPAESWGTAYAKIKRGDFFIRLTDSSYISWVAIGKPSANGRFDAITNRLLSRYYFFIMAGIAVFILVLMLNRYIPGTKRSDVIENKPIYTTTE